jgi:glycosyltransferase involved in cell wall biosynthesis
MKLLSIGTDRKLFEEGSGVFLRTVEYASKFKEMHVVVFSLRKHGLENYKKNNLFFYQTNSSSRWFYVFDALRIAKKLTIHEGFSPNSTVVTCQDPFETGLVGYLLKRKFHLPLQLQLHTDFLSEYFRRDFLNILRVFIANFTLQRADGIRVVSSVISDSIKKRFPKLKAKITVLPIFVDTDKMINREVGFSSQGSLVSIVMVSRFTKEKRIEDGIYSFKKVLENNSNARLSIVGTGPEKENILSKISELKLESYVKVSEWENDVILVFKKANIFLLTSEYEGYGMTLIEAGASGCPIVTTNVGVAKTDLFVDGFNSHICPVGDVDCIANKLNDLIRNPEKRKLFKQRMQDNIRAISIGRDEYVSRYTGLIKELIKND